MVLTVFLNSWPTSSRAAEQVYVGCPFLSPLVVSFSVRKVLALGYVNGTACVLIDCTRTAWVYLAPFKAC